MSEKPGEESVLGSLPATRPTRFGRERGGGTATKERPKAAAKPRAKAKAKGKPKPASSHGPRAVRPGNDALAASTERAHSQERPPESTTQPPSGTELVTTAIQAAGELAQIGLAVGGQVLRRAVDKLPKP